MLKELITAAIDEEFVAYERRVAQERQTLAAKRERMLTEFRDRLDLRVGAEILHALDGTLHADPRTGAVWLAFTYCERDFVVEYLRKNNIPSSVYVWRLRCKGKNDVLLSDAAGIGNELLLYIALLTDQAGFLHDELTAKFFGKA